ncbi:MAG TPA: hypothetical protein DCR24_09570 [Bacillus bacterium]|nr:hypothetical protein [Bacillus sp. (in: firmicutes)]
MHNDLTLAGLQFYLFIHYEYILNSHAFQGMKNKYIYLSFGGCSF